MSKQKRYSQRTKFAALAKLERNGGNRYQTAKETGIPHATLSRWIKEAEQRGEIPVTTTILPPLEDDDAELDARLEQLARQMVEAMPEKVDDANLQELTRSLAIVLSTMNQARTDKEKSSHAREKLAEILERYAANGSAEGTAEATDGE